MARLLLNPEVPVQVFLEDLTSATLAVAGKYGLNVENPQHRAEMTGAIKRVLVTDLVVSDVCGLAPLCDRAEFFEPFSEEVIDTQE